MVFVMEKDKSCDASLHVFYLCDLLNTVIPSQIEKTIYISQRKPVLLKKYWKDPWSNRKTKIGAAG